MPRKVAYSGKQKREQLRQRNAKKQEEESRADPRSFDYFNGRKADSRKKSPHHNALSEHFVPSNADDMTTEDFMNEHIDDEIIEDSRNKLVSVFKKLTHQEIEAEKLKSMQPLNRLPQGCLEIDPEKDKYVQEYIDFPKRPVWSYEMSKKEVEEHEEEQFNQWIKSIEEKYGNTDQLSWYERNLEVWRQLWRVLEISDVILIIMDIRNPLLHFSRSLYNYVTQDLKRKIIGVFNKVDLVSEFTVFAWKKYFEEEFPEIQITTFSCFPRNPELIDDTATYALKKQAKRPKKRYYYADGVKEILSLCRDTVDKPDVHVDWKSLIAQYDQDDEHHEYEDSASGEEYASDNESDTGSMDGVDDAFAHFMDITSQEIKPHKNYITLGLVGHPNVGKSSLINSIMQRTVVSASKTPGHTKHFQTIHIAKNVRLCDSPGLVFPALIPRSLQILSSMYPIAQVQEPYSSIRYLAERIPLEKILSLTPPIDFEEENDPDYHLLNPNKPAKSPKDYQWSAWSILEAFGEQRGFHIAKTSSPDVYRAANTILRLTAEGRILLSFKPPGFFSSTKYQKLRVIDADAAAEAGQEDKDDEDYNEEDVSKGNLITKRNIFDALSTEFE